MNRQLTCFAILAAFCSMTVFAKDRDGELSEQLTAKIVRQLEEKIPNSKARLPNLTSLSSLSPLSEIQVLKDVRLIEDRSNGVAVVEVMGVSEGGREIRQVIQTPYEAWVEVPVANKRIFPNSKLKNEDFNIQKVNIASGMAREYRGVMVDSNTNLNQLESRQTILEGQFVTRNAVQKQPDVRKGEMIKLELLSGDLSLVTQAIVQEPASIGDRVHVLTLKTKKEIVGKVRPDHSIEVSL